MINDALEALGFLAIAFVFWCIGQRRRGVYQPEPGPIPVVRPPRESSGSVRGNYPTPEEAREMGTADEDVPKE